MIEHTTVLHVHSPEHDGATGYQYQTCEIKHQDKMIAVDPAECPVCKLARLEASLLPLQKLAAHVFQYCVLDELYEPEPGDIQEHLVDLGLVYAAEAQPGTPDAEEYGEGAMLYFLIPELEEVRQKMIKDHESKS